MSISKKIFIFLFFVSVAMPVSCVKYFAVGRSAKVDIYEIEHWDKPIKTLGIGGKNHATTIVFSPDGKYLACIVGEKKLLVVGVS